MLTDQIKNYRDMVTLKDGVSVLLRPVIVEDRQRLIDLFAPLGEEDLRYMRDDVRNPAMIDHWCNDSDFQHALPLLALVNERVVGYAALHFRGGPERHIGEVRIFLAKDFRQRGLGTRMLNRLIGLARHQGLHILEARVVADQSKVIKAFQYLGFNFHCTFDDYFMLPDGDLRDVAVLFLTLRKKTDEF